MPPLPRKKTSGRRKPTQSQSISPWIQLLVGSLAVTGLIAVVAVVWLSRPARPSQPVGSLQEVTSAPNEAAATPKEMASNPQLNSPQESVPATVSTQPTEVATHLVAEQPEVTKVPSPIETRIVRGTAMAYEIAVPHAWVSLEKSNGNLEHQFKTEDGGLLQIIAHTDFEDDTKIVEQMRRREELGLKKEKIQGTVVIENEARFEINGRACIKATIRANNPDGTVFFRKWFVSHSSHDGTFLLSLIEVGEMTPEVRHETDVMLASIKLPAPSVGKPTNTTTEFRELKGKAFPYSITIPGSWKVDRDASDGIEYEVSRLKIGTLRVAASRRRNALGNFKSDFLKIMKADAGEKVATTSKSIESVVLEGRTFIRHEIETQTDEGEPVTVIGFGCNAKEGSLLLMAATVGQPVPQSTRDEIETILRSTRISR